MAESHKQKKRKDDFLMQGAILAIAGVITKIIGVVYRIPLTNILKGWDFTGMRSKSMHWRCFYLP